MTMHHDDTHPREERIHDLVDGRLPPDARAAIEAHLDGCDACARRVARLRSLLAGASALPRELRPDHDGWPELRAALAARATAGRGHAAHRAAARRMAWVRPALAAAAILLVIAGWSALRRQSSPERTETIAVAAPPATATPGGARSFLDVERDYARAAAELTAQLESTRGRMSPSAAATVDRSLATIDAAIAEARAALGADPGNPEVAHFVASSYEQKLALLRRSTEITSGD